MSNCVTEKIKINTDYNIVFFLRALKFILLYLGKNHRFKKWKERRREEKRRGEETKKERGKNKRNGNGCMLNQKNEIR